ncbi:phosphate/phosphite/phosphonate ABC transporter substrate-binding protein [Candidatus Poriferisodalis sp.]|uniref:phosphate/phosphite/phosphonate ABC transporter substrate-binding protein n=1 Tax=Candidatus Poriferisodalis sp. TaxID=3101277 RepID=UPI003B5AF0C5
MTQRPRPLMIGATAADPKRAVFIWNAIRKYFNEAGLETEYALYSTYDALCGAVLDGHVDIAWNAPMAHAQLLLQAPGTCRTLAMRDTDEDVRSLIVARPDAAIADLDDLRGRRLALGVDISSELFLLPAAQLAEDDFDIKSDCELVELEPTEYSNLQMWVDDRTIFGAVLDGRADAGVIFEPWLGYLLRRHELAPEDIVEVWRTRPYCHCAFTSSPHLSDETSERFTELLVAMDSDDPDIAEMMRMEHLTKWVRATDDGWTDLMTAVEDADLVGKIF